MKRPKKRTLRGATQSVRFAVRLAAVPSRVYRATLARATTSPTVRVLAGPTTGDAWLRHALCRLSGTQGRPVDHARPEALTPAESEPRPPRLTTPLRAPRTALAPPPSSGSPPRGPRVSGVAATLSRAGYCS